MNPAPVPGGEPAVEAEAVETAAPLPSEDLLYLVRFEGPEGRVVAAAAAELVDGTPAALSVPNPVDESYRARFDSAFYAAGLELSLHAAGHRIGSIVLDGTTSRPAGSCLSVGGGTAILPPGTLTPARAFAWAGADGRGTVRSHAEPAEDNRMRTFGPVLAENLLRRGGERRPYLAQRVDLRAVPWEGDARPAMAATYLVNDDLAGPGPSNAASSLFVLARFDPTRGYEPEWWEVRRYGNGEPREAFTYLGSFTTSAGRVDVARRFAGTMTGLAVSVDREDRRLDWTEEGTCSALALIGSDEAG